MTETEPFTEEYTNIIGTSVCVLKMDSRSICYMTVFKDAHITLEEMKTVEKALFEIANNQPFRVIMDMRNKYIRFDNDARNYAAKAPITKLFIAEAILLNNLPTRLLYNFYLKFDKPDYSIKAFSTMQPAIEWLMSK